MDTFAYQEAEIEQAERLFREKLRTKIGREGGNALLKKHGIEYMRELGRRGGEATKKKLGIEYYRELGRKTHAAISPEDLTARSSKGGEATKLKYGREHYQRMASKSFLSRRDKNNLLGVLGALRKIAEGITLYEEVLKQPILPQPVFPADYQEPVDDEDREE